MDDIFYMIRHGGGTEVHSRTFDTIEEARAFLSELSADCDDPQTPRDCDWHVARYIDNGFSIRAERAR